MKKTCLLFLVMALPLNASDQGLFATASPDFAVSTSGISGAAAVSVWKTLGMVGLGVQVRTIVGFQIWDVSIAPMALLKLGVFDLGLGASFLVRQPDVPYSAFENGIAPAAMIGLSLPFLDAGPGKITASVGAGFLPTAIQKTALGPGGIEGLDFLVSCMKLYLGIGYTFQL
jgi:hypothetical protein